MRHNYTHIAEVPQTRNEFIDAVRQNKTVIVVSHTILQEIQAEVNSNLKSGKKGDFLKELGVGGGLLGFLFSTHPVGWLVAGGTALAVGIFTGISNYLKKYNVYLGVDSEDKEIIVLHLKNKVDLSYDSITYPSFLKFVDTKKANKKVKIKLK